MSEAALTLSLFIHIAATALWLGGLMLITFLVLPELQRALAQQPARYRILRRLRRRFTLVGNLALALLIVTGLLQMSADPHYEGLLRFENRWSQALLLKHLLIILMALAGLALQFGLAPALERASLLLERGKGDEAHWQRLRRRERRLTLGLVALALAILATSAWLTAI